MHVAVELSSLVLQAAKMSSSMLLKELQIAINSLFGLLMPTVTRARLTTSIHTRSRVLTLLAGAEARQQGLTWRSCLLLDSADLIDSGERANSEEARALLLSIAQLLLERALPREERERRFGGQLEASASSDETVCSATLQREITDSFVEATTARAEAAVAHRTHPSSRFPLRFNRLRNEIYKGADDSYCLLFRRLSDWIRLCLSEISFQAFIDEEVQGVRLSAERYQMAAAALEQGRVQTCRYWRRAAGYAFLQESGSLDCSVERVDLLWKTVDRSASAAKVLSDGGTTDVDAAVVRALCRASDCSAYALGEKSLDGARATFLIDTAECWAELAKAGAAHWEAMIQLLEDKLDQVAVIYAYNVAEEEEAEPAGDESEEEDEEDAYDDDSSAISLDAYGSQHFGPPDSSKAWAAQLTSGVCANAAAYRSAVRQLGVVDLRIAALKRTDRH